MAELRVLSDIDARVWKIEAAPGDIVPVDGVLMILESMKTEIPVEAPKAGRVLQILVREEETVSEGQPLAILDV